MSLIPALVALVGIVVFVFLLVFEKRSDVTQQMTTFLNRRGFERDVSERFIQTSKGFLFLMSLVAILGAILYYF